MPLDPLSPATFAFIEQTHAFYAALTRDTPHLGGRLFYADALVVATHPAVVAANIAGAATLSISADAGAARQAMRDGIVDFVVNSLDEALRILKNELRKRETVSVCVTAAPAAIEAEIHERGVAPDLRFAALATLPPSPADVWLTLRPAQSAAQWLPALDALALAIIPPEAMATRRWLQRATRYLGRSTRNLRVLHIPQQQAEELLAAVRNQITAGAITTPVEMASGPWGQSPAPSP